MEKVLKVKVAAKAMAADEIATFELAALDGAPLPGFEAGAHIDVHVPGGLVRQYSLYDPPGESRRYRIGVLRDPQSRGGSGKLVDSVGEGDVIEIGAPRNHFTLDRSAGHSLLFAGGIGITPILCMAQELAIEGRSFEMHYCGRSLPRMAFLERLRGADLASRVHIHADDGDPAQLLDARAAIGAPSADKHIYVCGPTGFMDHVLGTARDLGWPEERLHREYFSAAPVDHSADGPFELELKRSGRVIRVAADQSAAQAMLDSGIDVMLSCEQGVCGTCMTAVAGGVPDHRDLYLTDAEHAKNDCFTPCCSRSRTPRLVLNL
jgi:vanillate O-demethylase ferredoxin subunit